MKKNKFIIVIIVILVVLIFLVGGIYLFNKNNDSKDITGFYYYSGSSGYAIQFTGDIKDNDIDIEYIEYNGAEINTNNYTTINDISNLLNDTRIENCNKQTYEHQCGDRDGCSITKFYIYHKDSSKITCYKVNSKVKDYFKNLTNN